MSVYKPLVLLALSYVLVGGLIFDVPRLDILNETIRNLHFHVPMWFGMVVFFSVSVYYSILYLARYEPVLDIKAHRFAIIGMIYGVLGLSTGMIWAQYTWGKAWSNDPKQITSFIALMIYSAYFILRGSIEGHRKRATSSAAYNILAYPMLVLLLFILPRMSSSSLHPGATGNPGFNAYDLDSKLRLVFYPAVAAWIGLGWWIAELSYRIEILRLKNK